MQWATSRASQWRPTDMDAVPAFATSDAFVQGAPCDCGKGLPEYKSTIIPWEQFAADRTAQFSNLNWTNSSVSNTVGLIRMGYGWKTATDKFEDEKAIGLYLPSNPRYPVVTLSERDFLDPVAVDCNGKPCNGTIGEFEEYLMDRYFTGNYAPAEGPLKEELVFTAPVKQNKFATRDFTYKYGSCMRWPYGMVPYMSMSDDDRVQYFGDNNIPKGASTNVGEESLIGYCETNDQNLHYYCINDAMKSTERATFCSEPKAKRIVIGKGVNGQTIDSVCSKTHKTCLIIPNSPFFPDVNSLVAGGRDLTGYTILITPFHWETVAGLMYNRFYYTPGIIDNGKLVVTSIGPENTTTTAIKGLTATEFELLINNEFDVAGINERVENIVSILNCSSKCMLLWLDGLAPVDRSRVFAPVPFNRQIIESDNVTILAADPSIPLTFARPEADKKSPLACTQFYVSGKRFRLPNASFDNSECSHMGPLDRSAVVYGGGEVQDTEITIATKGAEMPVAFVGEDTSSFAKTRLVNVGSAMITFGACSNVLYAVGAARTNGTITVNGLDKPVLVQPYTWKAPPNPIELHIEGNVSTINISSYTALFGNGIMTHVYAKRTHIVNHAAYPVFGILVAINVGMLTYFVVYLFG